MGPGMGYSEAVSERKDEKLGDDLKLCGLFTLAPSEDSVDAAPDLASCDLTMQEKDFKEYIKLKDTGVGAQEFIEMKKAQREQDAAAGASFKAVVFAAKMLVKRKSADEINIDAPSNLHRRLSKESNGHAKSGEGLFLGARRTSSLTAGGYLAITPRPVWDPGKHGSGGQPVGPNGFAAGTPRRSSKENVEVAGFDNVTKVNRGSKDQRRRSVVQRRATIE